jgi:MFS family permease
MKNNQWLNSTVFGAGITSALGDFCYETATVLLPGFLAVLGLSASYLGLIEGTADAVANFTKIFSGYIANKIGHRKFLVVIGYALTPIGQIFLALASGLSFLFLGRIISWFGKGLRGPLRDAIVIQSISPKHKGKAFGFHRAADTLGAIVGPLLGIFLLHFFQSFHLQNLTTPFRWILWLSIIPGILSALAFLFLVKDTHQTKNPTVKFLHSFKNVPLKFKKFIIATSVFGLGNFSHSLFILAATSILTPYFGILEAAQIAGFLYIWRNIVQIVFSYPIGLVADKMGHLKIFNFGYFIGFFTSLFLAFTFWYSNHFHSLFTVLTMLIFVFFIAGIYISFEASLKSTVTSELVTSDILVTSYGTIGMINGFTKFFSSSFISFLWTLFSPIFGFIFAAFFMFLGSILLIFIE